MSLMNKSVFLMTKLYNKNIPVIPRAMQQMNRLIFATDIPRSVKLVRAHALLIADWDALYMKERLLGKIVRFFKMLPWVDAESMEHLL